MMSDSTIGFIGLGNMGLRMANNLESKGNKLKVYDINTSAATKLKATVCKSPKEVAENSSVIITMLPNSKAVREAVLSDNGVLKALKPGSSIIDCSTIEPRAAQELGQIAAEKGVKFLDAPVSGGIKGAEAATLTFMVGGKKDCLAQVEPILLKMGSKVLYCGESGAGQVAKLCNNLILAVTMIATCEGMHLGAKLGLDPKLLASVVNTSTGRSWSSDAYNPVPGVMDNVPSSNNYQPGFSVQLMSKDLNLAEDAATQCNAPIPLGAISSQIYRTMCSNGFKDKDFSSVYAFLKGNL